MKQIAVLGCGTVGSGVVEVFYKNRDSIERKAGCPLDIKWIYLRRPHPELPWQDKLCFDFDQIVSDPQVQIVVEVMGGARPGLPICQELPAKRQERRHRQQGADRPEGRRAAAAGP